jgi:hypothetical protein
MIGLPNPTLGTQWVAVASIIVYNFVFGYGWIGVPWLYGPEVRHISPFLLSDRSNTSTDCPFEIQTSWRRSRRIRRMAFLFHHRFRRWDRAGKCRMEDLDLDAVVLRRRGAFRVLHVP